MNIRMDLRTSSPTFDGIATGSNAEAAAPVEVAPATGEASSTGPARTPARTSGRRTGSTTVAATGPTISPVTGPAPPLAHRARLPRWAPLLTAAIAASGSMLAGLVLGWGPTAIASVALAMHLVVLPAWSVVVESRRAATDRAVASLVWGALLLALVPLVSLLAEVVARGAGQIDTEFLTWSMRNVIGDGGGIYHAIIGTLLITATAIVISVPVGLLAALHLVEYGAGSRTARVLGFLVDVMTGIPSIVAGLFAYALLAILFGPGIRLGFGGGLALSLLMVPIVVRSAEEMLKLVPDELREASYALGVPKWRTILHVVLPTALPGVITGVILAVARVVGETAPLLIVAGATDSVNTDLFSGQMESLPTFIYYSYTQPGLHPEAARGHAWGAALVLILVVVLLSVGARLLGRLLTGGVRGHGLPRRRCGARGGTRRNGPRTTLPTPPRKP